MTTNHYRFRGGDTFSLFWEFLGHLGRFILLLRILKGFSKHISKIVPFWFLATFLWIRVFTIKIISKQVRARIGYREFFYWENNSLTIKFWNEEKAFGIPWVLGVFIFAYMWFFTRGFSYKPLDRYTIAFTL